MGLLQQRQPTPPSTRPAPKVSSSTINASRNRAHSPSRTRHIRAARYPGNRPYPPSRSRRKAPSPPTETVQSTLAAILPPPRMISWTPTLMPSSRSIRNFDQPGRRSLDPSRNRNLLRLLNRPRRSETHETQVEHGSPKGRSRPEAPRPATIRALNEQWWTFASST